MHIQGSTALVTGANRGLGRQFAEQLLERGATVYAGVRDPASVTDPRLRPLALDVTDPAQVAAAAQLASDVDLVVNNAGVGTLATALTADPADARAEIEVNYLGLVAMTQAFAPVLAANGGGAFLNMLSVVSWVGMPQWATYAGSKAAAWGYTNAARVELADQGTQVTGVFVGFVDTDLIADLDTPKLPVPEVVASALDALEAGRPEALVDELSKTLKAGLADDQALIYPGVRERFLASRA